tara:strand:+ start:163914 stop:165623 length:1710 start_codon:yes stop_codon:yes gene_type:complete
MSYQVLSRKWRPRKFQDVIGQEHVTRSLQNAILKERLGHAYILTGTRGIGKTSIARIFGKSLRCSNRLEDGNACNECNSCIEFDKGSSLNVVEIDGASNNSVDDVRELINKVHTLPSSGKYKVYIIDEVHMLSTPAFNALLKTLEEPPEHVIFILATTEPQKLLNTVLSRCQRFDLRNASLDYLMTHLKTICEKEGIEYENDSIIKTICEQGKGSFRDTLSLMDQVLSFSQDRKLDREIVSVSLGLANTIAVERLLLAVVSGESLEVSNNLREIYSENVSLQNVYMALTDVMFNIIENIDDLVNIDISEELKSEYSKMDYSEVFWIFETLVKDYEWIKKSVNAEKVFEIGLRKLATRNEILSATPVKNIKKKSELKIKASVETPPQEPSPLEQKSESEPEPESESEQEVSLLEEEVQTGTGPTEELVVEKNWDSFLSFIETHSKGIKANLEHGNLVEPIVNNGKKLLIKVGFKKRASLFYEYFNDKEILDKLVNYARLHFETSEENTEVKLELLPDEISVDEFESIVDKEIRKEQKEIASKEKELSENPLLKQAQEMFNTKVDRIKVNK